LLTGFVQDRVDRKGDKEKAPAPPAIEHATECRRTSSQHANITADSMGTPAQSPPSPSLSTILRRPPFVLALPPVQRISNCRTLPRLLPRGHLNIDCKDGTPFTHAHHPTVLCPDPTAYERSILLFDLVDLVYSDLSHSRI
jgi:hypothetical protein